jgi:hypothetical protein
MRTWSNQSLRDTRCTSKSREASGVRRFTAAFESVAMCRHIFLTKQQWGGALGYDGLGLRPIEAVKVFA